jgi:hypothetical protein
MSVFAWLRKRRAGGDGGRLGEWRRRWHAAAGTPEAATVAGLAADLNGLALPEEEIEIEREMLDGLEQLVRLQAALAAEGLPVVDTGHRIVGHEACHFSAPTSMPDDAAQPSGRLIFTSARAIFAGGARALTLPWHTVAEVVQQERDVVLVRHDRETFHRFRCNVFADALCAGMLARTLARRTRTTRAQSS